MSKSQITLDSILGTYRWFYFNYTNRDGYIEPNSGYITLENKSKSKATPAKISGSLQTHVHNGTFKGLKKAEEKNRVGKRARKYRKNFWEIKDIQWDNGLDPEGNGFGVCEVKDDNGNPFLRFEGGDINGETYWCHGEPEWYFYLGKKVITTSGGDESEEWESDDEECGLTDDEKVRLGMLLSETEVEELATKGYISESLDEDSMEDSDDAPETEA